MKPANHRPGICGGMLDRLAADMQLRMRSREESALG